MTTLCLGEERCSSVDGCYTRPRASSVFRVQACVGVFDCVA